MKMKYHDKNEIKKNNIKHETQENAVIQSHISYKNVRPVSELMPAAKVPLSWRLAKLLQIETSKKTKLIDRLTVIV